MAAINQGEIYRYISKPWDDNEIVSIVGEAIEHQNLKHENLRLTSLTQAQNDQLKELNASLEQKVADRTAELRQALSFVEQTHSELKKAFLTSVQVFAGLIELRVAEHARSVAQRLKLPEAEVQNIMLAGLLHDIGKLGLPDDLLAKPFNALTPEQRAQVMKHPVIGQNILMGIEKFKEAAILVRHHHECYDGNGYPDHLAGIAIPQGSRILHVVNEYDSLLIGTLVQRALKPAEALNFLIENRGKRYDPAAVDAFGRAEQVAAIDPRRGHGQRRNPDGHVAARDDQVGGVTTTHTARGKPSDAEERGVEPEDDDRGHVRATGYSEQGPRPGPARDGILRRHHPRPE